MSKNLTSIIIPCFNAEHTIAEALHSIPQNSVSHPVEVIVIDDGSSDQSAVVAQQVRPDAIVVSQANQGASAARNHGISLAKGDWIQFLDADDALLPKTLEHRLELAHQTHADVVVTDWIQFSSSSGTISPAQQRELNLTSASRSADWQTCLQANAEIGCATSFWAPPAAVLYRRSTVQTVGAFRNDLPIIQDARFLFDAAFNGAKFEHLPEIGALYRISPNSLSRRDETAFWLDCLRNGLQIQQLWIQRDHFLSDAYNAALQEIFAASTQGLLREGHHSAFMAAKLLYDRGGQLSFEQRFGLHLLHLTGAFCTKTTFRLLRTSKAIARRIRSAVGKSI